MSVLTSEPSPEPASRPASEPASEFAPPVPVASDRRGPVRWIWSHLRRQPLFLFGFVGGSALMVALNSLVPTLTGVAFDVVLDGGPGAARGLAMVALALLLVVIGRGVLDLLARFSGEVLAKRLERDARDELYVSLLGKSQTFHNRQRVGDLMARAANDIRQLSHMITPGLDLIVDSWLQAFIPLIFIAFIDPWLLVVPVLFLLAFGVALAHYLRQLKPVSTAMREQFGDLNAGLAEAVRGVEVIKVTAQEAAERRRFDGAASRYRDLFVRNGLVQARYLPTLLLAVAMAAALWHALARYDAGAITIGDVVAFMGLMGLLGFPTFISIFSFSLVQLGVVSARRIGAIMTSEARLGEVAAPVAAPIRGEIAFDQVTFAHGDGRGHTTGTGSNTGGGEPVLTEVSFVVRPGESVAIVGETGSGKSTLVKLVPRIYDVSSGRITIDGVDVREWSLDSLRSQIATIEQDIVLFSRSVAENIAFGVGQRASREEIIEAARAAQAHEFITELEQGYDTVIGERGVTLSGGQRQRLAIARALLRDPAILILDDSTSAIDSATEDAIQQAISRVQQGRTTLLITHRLSQIRWADKVLLVRRGRVVDFGPHQELLARSPLYQRIFAHHEDATTAASPVDGGSTDEEVS